MPKKKNMANEFTTIYWKIVEIMEFCKKIIGKIDAGLVGVAGSFWVMNVLTREGISFRPKFGRYTYDILLDNGKKIEVKSSNFKVSDCKYYAWSAQKKRGRLEYDFLFCVALPEMLKSEPLIYAFTKTQIEKMPAATESRNFKFWGNQYKQIAYLPDEKWWIWEEQMGNLRKYDLENIKDLKLFLR